MRDHSLRDFGTLPTLDIELNHTYMYEIIFISHNPNPNNYLFNPSDHPNLRPSNQP